MSLPARPFARTLRHVRAVAGEPGVVSDVQLLDRFVQDRDAEAFAELVRRHGRLVLGVARRRLADRHAAEDIFQATFLALARQARRLRTREPLEGWLYTVAHRLARKEQARAARRPTLIGSSATASERDEASLPDPLAIVSGRELLQMVDDELSALPRRYRMPILLCGLDGLARDEAAARLGWSLGTLRGRLERGRELLRKRLTKRGLTVPSALAGLFATDTAAAVHPALIAVTSRAALATLTAPAIWVSVKTFLLAAVAALAGVGSVALVASASRECERPEVAPPQAPVAQAPGSPAPLLDALGDPLPDGAIARLGSERLRPGWEIHAVAYSHDGIRLASWTTSDAYQNGRLVIWDVETGRALRRVDIPNAQIMAMRWLANGHGVAVLRVKTDDYYIWDFANPTALPPPSHPNVILRGFKYGELMAAAISPDGRWLATGRIAQAEEPRPIEVWDLRVNSSLRQLSVRHFGDQPGHGYQLAFSPDSRKLYALSATREPNRVQAGPGGVPVVAAGMFTGNARLVTYDVALGRQLAAFDVPAPNSEDIPFNSPLNYPA
jgi:RNA polymerase sigma factor (sigma-70 family)